MKVLPIKMPDDLYHDLKLVSRETGVPMAKFIKLHIREAVRNKAQQVRQNRNQKEISSNGTFPSEYNWMTKMISQAYKGKDHAEGLTDDEILYGGKLN